MINPKSPEGEPSVPYGAREILNSKQVTISQRLNSKNLRKLKFII